MKDLITELESTKANLLAVISSIPQEQFNTVPFEGSWTAAQVCDHVLKAIGDGIFYGKTKPTERAPDERIKTLADIFLNFETKLQSPDFILPTDKPLNKHVVLTDMESSFDKLITAAQTLDLTATCLDFEMPVMGQLTRLEFLWFYVFHSQRHTHQLNKIAKALAE